LHRIPRATVETPRRTLFSASRSSPTPPSVIATIVVVIVRIVSIAAYPRADKLAHTTREIICHLWAVNVNEVAPSSLLMGAVAKDVQIAE